MILEKPRRVKDQDFLDYVKSRPCLLLGKYGHVCSGPVDANHITPKGGGKVGSKVDDKRALPFCRALHEHYHFLGSVDAFEKRFPVILEFELLRLQHDYRAPKKTKREQRVGVLHIEVRCRCAEKTHRFAPSKVVHTETGLYWNCPVLHERIEVA